MDQSKTIPTKLRRFIAGEYGRCCDEVFDTLVNDLRFNAGLTQNDLCGMSLNEFRLFQYRRAKALAEYQFIETENVVECPVSLAAFCDAVSFIDWGAAMKYFLNRSVCSYYVSAYKILKLRKQIYIKFSYIYEAFKILIIN